MNCVDDTVYINYKLPLTLAEYVLDLKTIVHIKICSENTTRSCTFWLYIIIYKIIYYCNSESNFAS